MTKNKDWQINFVTELSKTIANKIITQIQEGKIPENWDGLHLRILLAYHHRLSAKMIHEKKITRQVNNQIRIENL